MRKIVTGNTQQEGFVGRTLALKMGQSNLGLMLDFAFAASHLKCFTKRRGPTSRRWAGALPPHKLEHGTCPLSEMKVSLIGKFFRALNQLPRPGKVAIQLRTATTERSPTEAAF